MLKWFIEELKKAEAEKIKVHVIGHIPPGSIDCLKVWEKNFYNIISRYVSFHHYWLLLVRKSFHLVSF